jgi:hypothetical protein
LLILVGERDLGLVRLAGGRWLRLIYRERKILLVGWWLVLNWRERKALLAGGEPASRTRPLFSSVELWFMGTVPSQ